MNDDTLRADEALARGMVAVEAAKALFARLDTYVRTGGRKFTRDEMNGR